MQAVLGSRSYLDTVYLCLNLNTHGLIVIFLHTDRVNGWLLVVLERTRLVPSESLLVNVDSVSEVRVGARLYFVICCDGNRFELLWIAIVNGFEPDKHAFGFHLGLSFLALRRLITFRGSTLSTDSLFDVKHIRKVFNALMDLLRYSRINFTLLDLKHSKSTDFFFLALLLQRVSPTIDRCSIDIARRETASIRLCVGARAI